MSREIDDIASAGNDLIAQITRGASDASDGFVSVAQATEDDAGDYAEALSDLKDTISYLEGVVSSLAGLADSLPETP